MEHNLDELPSTSQRELITLDRGIDEMQYVTMSLPVIVYGGFKNLTATEDSLIPEEVQTLLSWGPKFLPPNVSTVKLLMKNISTVYPETYFTQLIKDQYSDLQKFYATKPTLSDTELELQHLFQVTNDFLMKNPDLCIVRGDKCNITTLIDKSAYRMKMDASVSYYVERGIYRLVEGDFSTEREAIFQTYQDIVQRLNDVYNAVAARGVLLFPKKFYEMLGHYMREDLRVPYLYGIVQCHKESAPLRPMWKTLDWYSNPIQNIVSFVLSKFIAKYSYPQNVKDKTAATHELYTVPICEGYEFVKYHIKDMYNEIEAYRIIDIVEALATGTDYEALKDKIPSSLLVQCLRFTIEKTSYFSFNQKIYKQKFGLSEGAFDSALFAGLLLDYLIQLNYTTFFDEHRIVYWWKNKDNILVYIPPEYVESFQEKFEEITRLQLIVEREEKNYEELPQIHFIDLAIIRGHSSLEISLYPAPSASLRMLHYLSNHLITYKRNALRQLIQEVLERTHNRHLEKDLTHCEQKFYNNSYPTLFVADAFLYSVSKEIAAISDGRPSLPMSKQKLEERVSILENLMKRFSYILHLCNKKSFKIYEKKEYNEINENY